MTEPTKAGQSIWERSSIVRFFRWLGSGRQMLRAFTLRRLMRAGIALAWTATLVGLFYGEEHWRGQRAWNKYREATEGRGESLDFTAYIPKPVPDDQNFAATPFLESIFQHRNEAILTNDLYARASARVDETNSWVSGPRHFADLVAWQMAAAALATNPAAKPTDLPHFQTDKTDPASRAAAAPAVLEGMKIDEPAFAELRAASTRKYSRYPLVYDLNDPWEILLPHLARVKQLCQRLRLTASAELAEGQSEQALADVKLSLVLADSIKSEPFLISVLVRIASFHINMQPVWEGLAEHHWTDAELQELEARLLSYNFLEDMQQPVKAERACGVLSVDLMKKRGAAMFKEMEVVTRGLIPLEEAIYTLIIPVIPSGWYDLEKLNYCEQYDAQSQGVVDLAAKTISPFRGASTFTPTPRWQGDAQDTVHRGAGSSFLKEILNHHIIALSLLPNLKEFAGKIAVAQTDANQAALACALERYRLAKGQFPEALEGLAPQFISRVPNDVITGQPYKYRRTEDGRFVLYSIGWNGKDDGGVPGRSVFDLTQGDWVWEYPAR